MIEPQNTMMPLAADSAPVDLPEGEQGFGAMLAQTLGMIPQLGPNAVQQIGGRQGDGEQDTADLSGESNPNLADSAQQARVGRYPTSPITGKVTVVETPTVERPPITDARFVDPVYAEVPPPAPDTLPELPAPSQNPIEDGIGDPVLNADVPSVIGDSLPSTPPPVTDPVNATPAATTPSVATAPTPPEVAPSGDFEPVDPVVQPRPERPPSAPVAPPADIDPAVAPVRTTAPGLVAAEPARPRVADKALIVTKPDRGLPVPPDLDASRPAEVDATAQGASGAPAPQVSHRDAASDSTRVVRMGDRPAQVAAGNTVPLRESTVRVDGGRPTPQSLPNQMIAAEGAPQPTVSSTPVTAPAAPIQHSALAARVMQAVEMQANQPPPRTMVVDIPEIEGLRLVVSVRSGAEVHVVPASGSTATHGVQPFLEELQGVLENRGFVMTGDDRRRNGQRQDQDEPAATRPSRPTFRRAERTDNDLRI